MSRKLCQRVNGARHHVNGSPGANWGKAQSTGWCCSLCARPPVCLRADARFLKTTSILFCSLIHTNTSTSPPTVYPSIRICTHPHSLPITQTHINSTITMATEVRGADSAPSPPAVVPRRDAPLSPDKLQASDMD